MSVGEFPEMKNSGTIKMLLLALTAVLLAAASPAFCIEEVTIKRGSESTALEPWYICAHSQDLEWFSADAKFIDKDGNQIEAPMEEEDVKWTIEFSGEARIYYDGKYRGSSFTTDPDKHGSPGSITFALALPEGSESYNPGEYKLTVSVNNPDNANDPDPDNPDDPTPKKSHKYTGSDTDWVIMKDVTLTADRHDIAAGAIDSAAHQTNITVDVEPVRAGIPVRLTVAGGRSHEEGNSAKLQVGKNGPVAYGPGGTLEATTDKNGEITATVTSSDVYRGQCTIKAECGNEEEEIEFNWDDVSEEGEWVSEPNYIVPGGVSTQTLTLKHHRGGEAPPLNGHEIRFFVEEVQYRDENGKLQTIRNTAEDPHPDKISGWASFPDTPSVTNADGEVSVDLQISDRDNLVMISMAAYDWSLWNEPVERSGSTSLMMAGQKTQQDDRNSHDAGKNENQDNAKAKVVELSFSGTRGKQTNKKGKKHENNYHAVWKDGQNRKYKAPHYKDKNLDGDAVDRKDRRYPVAYTAGTKAKVGGKLKITVNPGGGDVKIKGDGPGKLDIPVVSRPVSNDNTVTLPPTSMSGSFSDKVNYHNPLTIDWQISFDGGKTWCDAGTTKNEVFVVLGPSKGAHLFRTVLHLACKNTGGRKPAKCLENTWKAFSGPANVCAWNGVNAYNYPLHYYKTNTGHHNRAEDELLRDGDGQCSAWARLLKHALLVNNVQSKVTLVLPPKGYSGFAVKNIAFKAPSNPDEAPWIYKTKNLDERPQGLPGQNMKTPNAKLFEYHVVVHSYGKYYDPSYGVTVSGADDFTTKFLEAWSKGKRKRKRWRKKSSEPDDKKVRFKDRVWIKKN